MKKFIALLSVISICFSMFCACGKSDTTDTDETSTSSNVSEKESSSISETTEQITTIAEIGTTSHISSSVGNSKTNKTSTADKTVSKNARIKNLYIETMNNNKYEISELNPSQTHPTYSLYDFDNDGTPELLIWAVKVATYVDRDINVYKYNSKFDKVDYMGKMTVLSGHSEIGESLDKKGIVISTNGKGNQDTITQYTIKNDKIESKILLSRDEKGENEWLDAIKSAKYATAFDLKQYFEDKDLDAYFK